MNMTLGQIMDWFYGNYIEENSEIDSIVDNTCITTACSIQSLYESCVMVKKVFPEIKVLRTEAKFLGQLSNIGIIGYEAGKVLINKL